MTTDRFSNIALDKNYERVSTGRVFTGKQIHSLLEIATPAIQAIVLLDIQQTDKPATDPESKYGI